MDITTRIKVLERMAQSSTPDADKAIGRACEHAYTTLASRNEYEALDFQIEVLATVGFRRSKVTVSELNKFLHSIETRPLVHSEEYGALHGALSKFRNAHTLMSKGIEVLSRLRYMETQAVVDTLLWASKHGEERVRRDSIAALRGLAKYNLAVYSGKGTKSGRGIGAAPQLSVIELLEKKSFSELKSHLEGVLTLFEGLLSTSMDSAKWSSIAVTLFNATTPAEADVVDVRHRSIILLKKLYNLVEAKSEKLSIIRVLNVATRAESKADSDTEFACMISANTQEVLAFYVQIAESEELQIIQKLEHDAYWIYCHSASDEIKAETLKVKSVIDANKEYSIYKVLVGFEGIFGDWSASKSNGSLNLGSQDARLMKAREFVFDLPNDGFDIWRRRILAFAMTESEDLATFPVFYEFLAEVARFYPDFALNLLIKDSSNLTRFLIPILIGLWDGEKRYELRTLICERVQRAQPGETSFLYASAKLFLSAKKIDVSVLKQLLDKATELKDAFVLRQIMSVAITRSESVEAHDELKALFLGALSSLTKLEDANWVRDVWFRKEGKQMVATFSHEERQKILTNLRLLPQISYQAEDLLTVLAEREPLEVLEFLCARLYEPHQDATGLPAKKGDEYEELPFQLHTLQNPLSITPQMVLERVLNHYRKDSSFFEFRGAKLLQIIFPQFPESFRDELIQLVRNGNDAELGFVARILRAYNGETFIHSVAKELIKRLPQDSELLNEVKIALQSTGVVSGEFGMAEAYETKRLGVLDWLEDPNKRIRDFAAKYISELEFMREKERERAEESIALRKFNFGS